MIQQSFLMFVWSSKDRFESCWLLAALKSVGKVTISAAASLKQQITDKALSHTGIERIYLQFI